LPLSRSKISGKESEWPAHFNLIGEPSAASFASALFYLLHQKSLNYHRFWQFEILAEIVHNLFITLDLIKILKKNNALSRSLNLIIYLINCVFYIQIPIIYRLFIT
jgi:hypothetical protein